MGNQLQRCVLCVVSVIDNNALVLSTTTKTCIKTDPFFSFFFFLFFFIFIYIFCSSHSCVPCVAVVYRQRRLKSQPELQNVYRSSPSLIHEIIKSKISKITDESKWNETHAAGDVPLI